MKVAQRLGIPLLVAGLQLGAAAVVLGRPSLNEAADFFVSREPTMGSAIAASQLTIWFVIAVFMLAALAAALLAAAGAAVTRVKARRRKRVWGALVMLVGLLILGLGLGHQFEPSQVTLTGGSVEEAQQQLAR
jgi:predicted PurR-regulated permease PerM